jgi:hypothetical protein
VGDSLLGGPGDEVLEGGAGADRFSYGLGDDRDLMTDLKAGDSGRFEAAARPRRQGARPVEDGPASPASA